MRFYLLLFSFVSTFLFPLALMASFTLTVPEDEEGYRLQENVSPSLQWSGAPEDTKSYLLVLKEGFFIYWLVYHIPPTTASLPEGVGKALVLPDGSYQGLNDFAHIGYNGPSSLHTIKCCALSLYALDSEIDLPPGLSFPLVEEAVEGHVLEKAEISGFKPVPLPGRHPTAPNPIIHSKRRPAL